MMAAHIRKRGKSFQVCFRRGGRAFPIEYAGTFPTKKEATIRRDLVGGWLAAGLDPKAELAKLSGPPARRSFSQAARAYEASRLDLSDGSKRQITNRLAVLLPLIGDKDVAALTPGDVQDLIAEIAEGRAPLTVRNYLQLIRLILDFADVDPNPARHRTVKPPRVETEEVNPPPAAHVLAILDGVNERFRLPVALLEQTAMRVGELEALEWGDVDVLGCQFRLRSATTKTSRARWVQVPSWLMDVVAATSVEDRLPERRVFPGFDQAALRFQIRQACKNAGIPHYHPHDLRHRRASLWHGQGVVGAEIAKRGGWSRTSVPLDVYSHVMPLEEIAASRYEEVLT